MANTLTKLIPDIYTALDVVSRELVGFIPSVSRDPRADRVALNQELVIEQTPPNVGGGDIAPAMAFPAAADQTIDHKTLTITKNRFFPFSWSGEEQYAVESGPGYLTIAQDQIAQALRAGVNEMEADIADAAYKGASRAYGTAGTTPFASDLSDPANIKKILDDNGTPQSDRHLVINTTAGAKLRTMSQLTKANEANDDTLLRRGTLLDIHNFGIRESAQVKSHVKGTGTGYLANGALANSATTIAVDTGTGSILAGDVVTFAGDPNKYIVETPISGGAFTINEPGLLAAVADNTAVTVGDDYSANVGYARNAILLATRLPKLPKEGDLALDRYVITDPVSGIAFEFSVYPGYRMNVYHVSIAWGVSVIKPEHMAILLG